MAMRRKNTLTEADVTPEATWLNRRQIIAGMGSAGLGLALVSKIISDHDGWISADSVPGRTVFRLSLRRAPKDDKKENA